MMSLALPDDFSGTDDGSDSREVGQIAGGVCRKDGEVGEFAGSDGAFAGRDAHSSRGIGGEHSEDSFEIEAAFAEFCEFAVGGVVGHVPDVGPEQKGSSELMKLAYLGTDWIHVMRVGGDGG